MKAFTVLPAMCPTSQQMPSSPSVASAFVMCSTSSDFKLAERR